MKRQMGKQIYQINFIKYKHHISKLRDLQQILEEMGISIPDDDTEMWVYLQSFKDDDILTDKYIYNFGIMDEEMKRHVGDVIDYDIYFQTIAEMKFAEFKDLYQRQSVEREALSLEYPGLIREVENPKKVKSPKEVENKKKKHKTSEEIKEHKEKLRKYQREYYKRVTKKKREEKRKMKS